MSKKLMVLAAGALAALAFTALPSIASAGEFEHHCTTTGGVAQPCTLTIEGGAAELVNTAGEGISCTSVTGTGSASTTGTTGAALLTFKGCRENITIFKFTCTSTGTAGEIKTNELVSHNIYIDPSKTTPGLLLTGVNVTFNCAGFAKKTVTGNVIGHLTSPNCSSAVTSMGISFEKSSNGNQKYKQVTTTGTIFDLISNNDTEGGVYLTSSQAGTGTIKTAAGQHIRLTC